MHGEQASLLHRDLNRMHFLFRWVPIRADGQVLSAIHTERGTSAGPPRGPVADHVAIVGDQTDTGVHRERDVSQPAG